MNFFSQITGLDEKKTKDKIINSTVKKKIKDSIKNNHFISWERKCFIKSIFRIIQESAATSTKVFLFSIHINLHPTCKIKIAKGIILST